MHAGPASYTAFGQKAIPGLLAYLVGLSGTLVLVVAGLVYIAVALSDRRPACPLRLAAGILGGFAIGVLFV